MHERSPSITTDPNTVQNSSKNQLIDTFGDKILVNPSNYNATILKFPLQFDKETCYNLYLSSQRRETKFFDIVTGTATKP